MRRPPQHLGRSKALGSQLAHTGIPGGLAQFGTRFLPDQRVMEKDRWLLPAEQPAQANLAAGGAQQVFAANDQVDFLLEVIHNHGEMIRPVTQAIAEQHVAALDGRLLHLLAENGVGESFLARIHSEPDPATRAGAQAAHATATSIPRLDVRRVSDLERDLFSRAVAGEQQPGVTEP